MITLSSLLATPFVLLTSCDSGPVNTGGESDFDLGTRFDADTLAASSGEKAEMPPFLLEGDSFEHDVNFVFPTLVVNSFSPFLPEEFLDVATEEYGRGFQFGDPAIIVNAAGQISNTEGEGVTDNVNYIYDPDTFSFSLTEQNSFPALGETALRQDFEAQLEAIENVALGGAGSLASIIEDGGTDINSPESSNIIEAAIESIGLVASDQGAISTLNPPQTRSTNVTARIDRTIRYEPTSTNAELMEFGEITGNVFIEDTIGDVVVINFDERNDVVSFNADTFTFFVNTGNVASFIGIDETVITYAGTFTYKLDGGDNF